MQEIVNMFQNNIGNKLTVELANGMITLIEKRIKEAEQAAVDNAVNTHEEE